MLYVPALTGCFASDILNTIIATKHREVAAQQALTLLAELAAAAEATPRPAGDFGYPRCWLPSAGGDCRSEKASPEQGAIRADFDLAAIVASYAAHGAACLSVLTDRDYFQGCPVYLQAACAACGAAGAAQGFYC